MRQSCTRIRHAGLAAALGAALAASGCALNPVTGTPELSVLSLEQELALGARAAAEIEQQLGLVQQADIVDYVRAIGARVAAESPRLDVSYRFHVLDSDFPNAYALPGGYVYVSRGLLALANSESELASVLGHEIGHIAARHASAAAWPRGPAHVLAGIGSSAAAILGLEELSDAAGRELRAAHSRAQEQQADEVGQRLAARAGFDPGAFSRLLRALERDRRIRALSVREVSFLDSHPVSAERIEATSHRARQLASAAPRGSAGERERFLARLRGLALGRDRRSGLHLTLELARARAGETLAEFCARTRNRWSLELTAAANGLQPPYALEAGLLLKYAHAEPAVHAASGAGVRPAQLDLDRSSRRPRGGAPQLPAPAPDASASASTGSLD